jgi:hypothetical protein
MSKPQHASHSQKPTQIQAVQHFLGTLYTDPPEDTYIVVSGKVKGEFPSKWFYADGHDEIAKFIASKAADYDVYINIGLRDPECTPEQDKRGTNEEVYALPGLWVEFDHSGGVHTAKNLPTREELINFIEELPFKFSLLINSGGGIHAYILFKKIWVLDMPEKRRKAAELLNRFQRIIQAWADERGWKVDPTSGLAQALRPAGTYNHKSTPPKPVTILKDCSIRYTPSGIAQAPWIQTFEDTSTPLFSNGTFPLVIIEPIVNGCAWLRHCRDDAATLPEPEWYAMLGIVGRCEDGEHLAHEWSAPDPRYTHKETAQKLRHALQDAGPRTCATIRSELGGEEYCRKCSHWETITSPINLGSDNKRRNRLVLGPEPQDPYTCPELPASVKIDEACAAEASPFLDEYIAFSKQWAPRAYEDFHEAVGLFVLSTIAARRIKIELGGGVYTSLYMALTARTTLFTKTTVAKIGIDLLDAAELGWLLADEDSTPQAFLHSLTLDVPNNYGQLSSTERKRLKNRLAFTAQRGWFYDEWGQHLQAMMRKSSMADFHGIMRKLDDHPGRHVYTTMARGSETLEKPYLTFLANATPADLQPFLKANSALWRDGYLARFAFITPDNSQASTAEFPQGERTFPSFLITPLQRWHKRLGLPAIKIIRGLDQKRNRGESAAQQSVPLPETTYTMNSEVRKAYYAYDNAMRELIERRRSENLDGSYGRFAIKALRIAGLLASLEDIHNQRVIQLSHWYHGQQIAERWRYSLHRLVQQVQGSSQLSPRQGLDEKLIHQVEKRGLQTLRDFKLYHKAHRPQEIQKCVTQLVHEGKFIKIHMRGTIKYGFPTKERENTHAL